MHEEEHRDWMKGKARAGKDEESRWESKAGKRRKEEGSSHYGGRLACGVSVVCRLVERPSRTKLGAEVEGILGKIAKACRKGSSTWRIL